MSLLSNFNSQNLILVGVSLHLLGGLAKAVFRTPKQQAQIDAIEAKVDSVLGEVQQVAPALVAAANVQAAAPPDLSLGLLALKESSTKNNSSAQDNSSAQGGAS